MESKDKVWYLERFDILQRMKKDDMMNMEKAMQMRKLNKDTILHFPEMKDRYIYFLKEGHIKISSLGPDGREMIKYIIKPGNIFGEMALLENQENAEDYAIAMEECVVCFMDVVTMKGLMEINAELNLRIRKLIGLRIRKVENRLSSLFFKDAPDRIFEFLKEFTEEFGSPVPNGYKAKFFLTHEDISRLTATARQTVSKIMARLREEGKIDYDNRYLLVYTHPTDILPVQAFPRRS